LLSSIAWYNQNALVFGANGDAGTELLRIASRELLVGMDLDPREQRLCIRRLNARRFQLGGPDLIVQQRRRDEVFQIVVGLLFGLRIVLRAKAPTARDVEARLEDVAAHVLNARRRQTVATLQIQHRFQHRLAMNERAVFLMTVCVTTSSEGSSQFTGIDWAKMRSSPFGPSNRPFGPVNPRLATLTEGQNGAYRSQ
jgi:hypothetical protein